MWIILYVFIPLYLNTIYNIKLWSLSSFSSSFILSISNSIRIFSFLTYVPFEEWNIWSILFYTYKLLLCYHLQFCFIHFRSSCFFFVSFITLKALSQWFIKQKQINKTVYVKLVSVISLLIFFFNMSVYRYRYFKPFLPYNSTYLDSEIYPYESLSAL